MTVQLPGRELRRQVPRQRQAAVPGGGRDPVAVLERQAVGRLPELLPLRCERMAASPSRSCAAPPR